MKRLIPPLIIPAVVIAFVAGCASNRNEMTKEAVLASSDVKGKPPTTFPQPLPRVHDAAVRALTSVGCKVEKNETYCVAGSRPRKFGLLVGSGGEEVQIFMLPEGDKMTNVWVDTDLTYVGIAGQQGWNKQVLAEMTSLLQ